MKNQTRPLDVYSCTIEAQEAMLIQSLNKRPSEVNRQKQNWVIKENSPRSNNGRRRVGGTQWKWADKYKRV